MSKLITFISTAALFVTSVAVAQSPPALEAYGALPSISLMTISPSGKRIAYRTTTSKQDAIVVVDLDANEMISGLAVGEISARELRFVDDDNLIIIAGRTAKALGFRGQFDYSAAFRFTVANKSIEQLLKRAKDLFPAQSGLGEIVGVADKGGELLMPAFHIENIGVGDPRYGLYSVVVGKNRARLIEKGDHSTINWFADGDGKVLARVDYQQRENKYRVWSLVDKRKLIFELETEIPPAGAVGVLPEGDALVYAARPKGADFLAFFRMDLDDGEVTGPIVQRSDASVAIVHSDINRTVHGVQYSGFTPSYEFFDSELNTRVSALVNELEGTSATLVSWSDDFRDLLVHVSGGWNSGVYLVFRADSEEPEIIASTRPDIAPEQVVPTVTTSYPARDGLEIPALVTALSDVRAKGDAPLVVLPHGGPASHDRLAFDWMAQYFASRGYVVLQPQFRGSSGFGSKFRRAGYGEWGGKMQSDIDDGVDHLVDSGLADPERICIVGASYGGYAALAAGAFSPDKYRCIASIAGISDLTRMLKTDRRKYGRDHWAITYWERQYGGDAFDWDELNAISPIKFVDKYQAPVLLIHGRKDTVVPSEQSKIMRNALRKAGKDVTMVELEGEDHWLSYRESRLATLRALAAFVDEHL